MAATGPAPARRQSEGGFLLGSLSFGHLSIHWFQQLYPVIIPSVKASLGLTDVQVGALASVRQFTTGPLMLPGGMLADFFRSWTAVILAASFLFLGISYLLVALSPAYVWILPAVALLGVGSALWHPAAMGSLSLRFPERRGSALALHGVGASIGDTIAPIGIGGLLLVLAWQDLLKWHMVPAVLLALIVWKALGRIYSAEPTSRPTLGGYWTDMKSVARNRVVLSMVAVTSTTSMARISVLTFLPIYLQDDLGYSTFILGVYIALLHAMGTLSQPAMGALSDRFGRKAVLLPALMVFGLLYLAMAVAEPGVQLSLVIGALGLFFYALATLTQATVMDVASTNVQASSMGVSTVLGQVLSLPGPIIAGAIVSGFGTQAAFLYAGAVTLLAAAMLALIRVPRSSMPTPRMSG